MNNNLDEKLLKIIDHYGVMHQLRKFNEECFELVEAIILMQEKKRQMEGKTPEIVEPVLNDYRKHITEEMADVIVMLSQFKEYYHISDKDILNVMEQKVDRQLKRIEEEKGYDKIENNLIDSDKMDKVLNVEVEIIEDESVKKIELLEIHQDGINLYTLKSENGTYSSLNKTTKMIVEQQNEIAKAVNYLLEKNNE